VDKTNIRAGSPILHRAHETVAEAVVDEGRGTQSIRHREAQCGAWLA